MAEQLDEVDFALAAFRDESGWVVEELAHDLTADVDTVARALRRLPAGDEGAVCLIAVDEDFFLILRVVGPSTRVLLSDITAADEWDLARSAVEFLGLSHDDLDDEDDEQVPAGDLDLLGDLGLHAIELGDMLDDPDVYPDELLSDVARLVGFGELFDDIVGLTSA